MNYLNLNNKTKLIGMVTILPDAEKQLKVNL